MHRLTTLAKPMLFAVAALVLVAAHAASGHPDDDLETVRQVTARFADIEVARSQGWNTQVTPCMESEAGGQGFHYGNPALISDSAALDPLRPELLMYEPQADGSLAYVGIEYIIPVADWTRDEPPTLFGQAFHVNERFNVWVLHVWWRDNPDGIFADFNPTVSCRYAA